MKTLLRIVWRATSAGFLTRALSAITWTGSNGRSVDFLGIKSATPKGITVQMVEDGPIIGIPWEKLDMEALERDQKLVYAGYIASKDGETIDLNIGSYESDGPPGVSVPKPTAVNEKPKAKPQKKTAPKSKYPGWQETKVGNVTFYLQPSLGETKGILILAMGQFGRSMQSMIYHQAGSGTWGDFQSKLKFSILTYEYADRDTEIQKPDDFSLAHKGSGEDVEKAIANFALQTQNPDLVSVPLAVYGSGRTGAAFAYNFVQWKPERVVAAVAAKGAFYDAEVSDASRSVPMLLLWGQYSNVHELWSSKNYAQTVLAAQSGNPTLWTGAQEFRGGGQIGQIDEYLGRQYLLEMIPLRLEEKTIPPPEKSEEEKAAEAAAIEAGEEPAKPEPPKVEMVIIDLDRGKGQIGNLKSGDLSSIDSAEALPGEGETFVPGAFDKYWQKFIRNELDPRG